MPANDNLNDTRRSNGGCADDPPDVGFSWLAVMSGREITALGPIDKAIGKNIRAIREARGKIQGQIGASLGLSWQQIQKYEKGETRVSVSVLYQLSVILDVPITAFYASLDNPESDEQYPVVEISENTVTHSLEQLDLKTVILIGVLADHLVGSKKKG